MSNKALFHNQQNVINKYVESKGKNILDGKKVYRKINCVESKNYGNELRFQVPRVGNMKLKHAFLRVDLPAFTGFSGGAYVRYVNAIGVRLFERFQLWSGGKMVLERYPDEIIYNLLPNVFYEHWEKVARDIAWDTTAANRNTLGAAAQNLVIDLKYIFDIFQKAFPIFLLRDEQNAIELRFQVQSHQNKVVQTDHTTIGTASISDVFLECIYQDQAVVAKLQHETHKKLVETKGGLGYSVLCWEYYRRNHPVAASASTIQDIDIRQFQKLSLSNIIFLVRDTADLSTAYAYDYDDDLKAVTSFQLKNGSSNLFLTESQITDTEYRKMVLPQYNFKGIDKIYNRNNYHLSFSEDQEKEFDAVKNYEGAYDTSDINDFRLNVVLASTSTGKTVDIIATSFKMLSIIGGELKVRH